MKHLTSAILAAATAAFAVGAPIDRATFLRHAVQGAEQAWPAAQAPAKANPRTSAFFVAALALCEAGAHPERLELLVTRMQEAQDRDPQSPHYGSFRWNWNDQQVTDQNAIEFCMQPTAILWLKHRDRLAPEVRAKLHGILEPGAIVASLRHRVSDGYTNIALMSATNLIMLGEGLGRSDVADEGYKRLDALFTLTQRSGIREYASPDYYGVDLDALQLAAAFAQRSEGRRKAQALLELLWTDVAANFWWPSARLSGAHSRNYDYLYGVGGLDKHLWGAGWLKTDYQPGAGAVTLALAQWWPQASLEEMSRTRLPRLVRHVWGSARSDAKATPGSPERPAAAGGKDWAIATHWLGRDVTLGIGGANYGPIDIPLAVHFTGSRDTLRCYFIPDGRGDAYGKSKIPWRGHSKAVHLQPFFAAVQETRDALALTVYREKDIPDESTSLHSHFVMPRAVDMIFVGDRRVLFERARPEIVTVAPGEPVFIRQGTAALALRIHLARTVGGETAPVALVWDGNEWDAMRLTVDHKLDGSSRRTALAAVALQVRVGSELDDASFARFRGEFQSAKSQVIASSNAIVVRAGSGDGILAVGAEAPWARPSLLEPSPPGAVLEIDGKDLGKAILATAQ
ncbi:MAG: hypothetical protein KBA71_08155 [Opitutaceae bacterium]|nr:hypothetical protein [Opitutaceae bacterium]